MNPTFGQRGDAVKAYQTKLNQDNQGKTGYTPLVVDGIYGDKTQAASNFQIPKATPLPSSVSTSATFADITSAPKIQGELTTPSVPPVDTTTPRTNAEIVLAQQATPSVAEQNQNKSFEQILQDMAFIENKGADTAAALETSGFNTAKKTAQDLANQILANTAGQTADKLSIGMNVGGITSADRSNFESEIDRNRAIKNLNLTAQLQAAQGNMALAKDTADQAINAKYAKTESRLANLKEFLTLNKDNLNREQEKQLALTNAKIKDLETVKANEKSIQEIIQTAIPAGAPTELVEQASKAKSPLEAAKLLGKYSPDTLKYELLKEQLRTEKAQQSKIYADIAKTRTESGTTNNGKPFTATQIESAGYADRINQANTIIDANPNTFANMNYAQFKLVQSKSQIANSLLTPEQRQVAQAMRNFITAKLRKESGAAISPTEFEDARMQYFPALKDDQSTLNQKKQLRDSVLNNLVVGSGGAYSPTTKVETNPFAQSLGESSQSFTGTSILSGTNKNGTLNFNIPTN